MDQTRKLLLAIDFGGTKGAASISEVGAGEMLACQRFVVHKGATGPDVFAMMVEAAQELLSGHSGTIAGVGVSFGGHVDAERGIILRSLHVPGWDDFPLSSRLETLFGAPVAIENDANAGALGEWRFGAGKGAGIMLYITVSTGVGGGLILNGRVVRGADGMSGEIGHMQLDPAGPLCSCGHRGCLEAMASGISIARNARELLSEDANQGGLLRDMTGGDLEALTAEMVSAAAAAGDELAAHILTEAATALGRGVGNALSLLNPDIVVLGGGVTKAGSTYWATLRRVASEIVLPGVTVRLVPAALGDEAPLWGGTALAAMVSEGAIS